MSGLNWRNFAKFHSQKVQKIFRKFQVIFNSIFAIIARVSQRSNFKHLHYLCILGGHTPYFYLSSIVVLTKVINYPHNSREIVLRHTLTTYLCLVLTKWGHKLRRMDACFRRITWDISKVKHHKYYKNPKACTFALVEHIGSSGQYWKFLHFC